jgi:CNT family concentrative nucleoside transporter
LLLSTNRRAIKPRIVVLGLLLQVAFAFVVLRTAGGRAFFQGCNEVITDLLAFSQHGANFIFGGLAPAPGQESRFGFIFAFQVLTTIIFFASLMSVLYHLGVMQLVVKGVAWVMQRTLRTSGAETLSAAANIFVGQTEAPLLIKPFIARMTRSEIMAVMTGGFATVAGGVMAAYVAMLIGVLPDIAGHLMAASVMAAPTGLVLAKIMLPERRRRPARSACRSRRRPPT